MGKGSRGDRHRMTLQVLKGDVGEEVWAVLYRSSWDRETGTMRRLQRRRKTILEYMGYVSKVPPHYLI